MKMTEVIAKKRDGGRLSAQEIRFFVQAVRGGEIPDYQSAALLMAIYLRGMDEEETANLTMEMAKNGDMADLSQIEGVKVDKHSTGGVGDLTTLVALPIAAACGVKVAKMSGRALGHTGGTLDKLWSIPGCRTDLTMEAFIRQVNEIGCALIGQTKSFAPVDKKLYALRDVTATVESLPLIVSSILSKKIAAGADAIVLDVKTGSGAFMQELSDSVALAKEMVKIGKLAGKKMVALVTDMDEPLGSSIGNALEVKEAISILSGEDTHGRAGELCLLIASEMIALGLPCPIEKAKGMAKEALVSGRARQKLQELILAQGGDGRVVDEPKLLPSAAVLRKVVSRAEGYVQKMDCRALGLAVGALGAGRRTQEEEIDYAVGAELQKRVGSYVQKREGIALIHAKTKEDALDCERALLDAILIGKERPEPRPLVFCRVD